MPTNIKIEGMDVLTADMDSLQKAFMKMEVAKKLAYAALPIIRERAESGIDVTGGSFQPYSIKPMYQSRKQGMLTGLGKGVGKTGKTTHSNGERYRSVYLAGGYAELRNKLGRSTIAGRLNLTGKMLNNMTVSEFGNNAAQIHFPRNFENAKAAGNHERYNWFGLSPSDEAFVMGYLNTFIDMVIKENIQ